MEEQRFCKAWVVGSNPSVGFTLYFMQRKTVLILGGGFGGVRAGLDLCRNPDLEVVMIDNDGSHYFQPNFYKTLSFEKIHGQKNFFERELKNFSIPLKEIFRNKPNFSLIVDNVSEIDLAKKEVGTKLGKMYNCDYLIIALGSETEFFGNSELKEFALEFKSPQDALNVRNAFDELFERKGKREPLKTVIVGGGLSGCELAANLAEAKEKMAKAHGYPSENVSIEILEAGSEILCQLSPSLKKIANQRLNDLGIKISVCTPVLNVENGKLNDKNGKVFEYDLLIWTAGVKGCSLVSSIKGVKIEKKNTIRIDEYLQIRPFQNVFAIGDIAYFKTAAGKTLPMTAQTAYQQGAYAARATNRLIYGKKLAPFKFKKIGFVAPLGNHFALLDFGWLKLSGKAAYWIKMFANLRYLLSILPVRKAIQIWREWV